jgi:hypothetical protein
MNPNPTEDEIVQTLLEGLNDEDLDVLRRMDEEELINLHHGFGTYIRNTYGLWRRAKVEETADSEQHPDAISMRIIHKLHARLRADDES